MQGSMTVSTIENGFLVHGGFIGGETEWPSTMYFDDFEDALDYIREQAGQVMDAELVDNDGPLGIGYEEATKHMELDEDIGWCD